MRCVPRWGRSSRTGTTSSASSPTPGSIAEPRPATGAHGKITVIESLQAFIEDLRGRGVAVSPVEAVDAARAAAIVGPEDRARFRAALAMTLAKDLRSLSIFDEAFDGFFLPPARSRRGGGRGEEGAAAGVG